LVKEKTPPEITRRVSQGSPQFLQQHYITRYEQQQKRILTESVRKKGRFISIE
jgi:hypothetical protein